MSNFIPSAIGMLATLKDGREGVVFNEMFDDGEPQMWKYSIWNVNSDEYYHVYESEIESMTD